MSPRRKSQQSQTLTTEEKLAADRSALPDGSAFLSHVTQGPTISPTPRPLRKTLPEDVFVQYDAAMRVKAAGVYRELQKGPVHIENSYPEVITWMRARGVRIKTRMSMEGSFYELESDVPVPS